MIVNSAFSKDVLEGHVACPIYLVAPIAKMASEISIDPAFAFEPADAGTVYLTSFDAKSKREDKNPFEVIAAFRRAFPPGSGATLVVIASNIACYLDTAHRLRREVERIGGRIIDCQLSVSQAASLVSACDVYIALHHSEEIGLDVLDAMALGKPVVATAFASNGDFVTHSTACPVAYKLISDDLGGFGAQPERSSKPGLGPIRTYRPNGGVSAWAEPDVEDAAIQLVRLHEQPKLRTRLGESGQEWVTENNGERTHANQLRSILERLL